MQRRGNTANIDATGKKINNFFLPMSLRVEDSSAGKSNDVRDGASPKTLQRLMGHADIKTTLQYYTHLEYEDVEKERRELEEKLRKEVSAGKNFPLE